MIYKAKNDLQSERPKGPRQENRLYMAMKSQSEWKGYLVPSSGRLIIPFDGAGLPLGHAFHLKSQRGVGRLTGEETTLSNDSTRGGNFTPRYWSV